jgi:glycosyltransferase involved in cell wall biosynthesis
MRPEEIAEKAIFLLKNPDVANRFGMAGYERVRKDFNLDDKAKEYIVVYESLIKGKEAKLS